MKQTGTLTKLTEQYLASQGIESTTDTATAGAARRRGKKTGVDIAARLDRLDEQTAAILAAVQEMHAYVSGERRRPLLGGRR